MLGSVFNRTRRVSGEVSVRTVLRTFSKGGNMIGYSEFQGFGPPALDYGLPGDIYLDLTPENMCLYARCTNDWKEWSGPKTGTMDLIFHPDHRDRCLWCTGDSYGWFTTSKGYKITDKTQHQLLAAVIEKAATKSGQGRKRRYDSTEGEQQNKRVQLSTSNTPPPTILAQTQRPSSTAHEATLPVIQRSTMSQPVARNSAAKVSDTKTSFSQPSGRPPHAVGAATAENYVSRNRAEEKEDNEVGDGEVEQDELVDDSDTSDGVGHDAYGNSNELSRSTTMIKSDVLPSETPSSPIHQSLANPSQNEDHYSSTAIATCVKPMLQELTRSKQAEVDWRNEEARLNDQIHRLQTSAETTARDYDARQTALRTQLTQATANAVRYAEELVRTRAQLDTEQENMRKLSQQLVAAQEDGKALKRRLEAESARSLREAEELQQSLRFKENLLKQSDVQIECLENLIERDLQRTADRDTEMRNLEATVAKHMAAETIAQQEVERLKQRNTLAATHAEQAGAEINGLKERVRVLEDENASLMVVAALYEQASKTTGQLSTKVEETTAELRAAQEEILQLKRDNAELLRKQADISSAASMQPVAKKANPNSTSSIRPKIASQPSGSGRLWSLRSLHVQALCADMDDHFLCRTCLASEHEVQHKLRKSTVLADSYRDIQQHYVEDHSENYDLVLGLDEDELRDLVKLVSGSIESQS